MTHLKSPLTENALRAAILLSLTLPSLSNAAELRQWTYTPPDGGKKVQFEAEFLGLKGATAMLKAKDGKTYKTPLANLSAEDVRYI